MTPSHSKMDLFIRLVVFVLAIAFIQFISDYSGNSLAILPSEKRTAYEIYKQETRAIRAGEQVCYSEACMSYIEKYDLVEVAKQDISFPD